MKPVIYYSYDAYCGWCYGNSSIITKLYHKFSDQIDFEVVSGGMIPWEKPAHIEKMADFLLGAYQTVEQSTGVRFGEEWLWHIKNPTLSDWHPASLKPAVALAVFKDYHPTQSVLFAADMQHALFFEGRDLCDDEAYRHLLDKYTIPETEFYSKLQDPNYNQKALEDFDWCKQLKVSGYPTTFMQISEGKLFMIAHGYSPFETVVENIEKVFYL